MQACWGNKWTSNFDEDQELFFIALAEWESGIADLSNEEIKEAYETSKFTMIWPPSIAEFRQLAKKIIKPVDAFFLCKQMYNNSDYKKFAPKIVQKVYNQIGSWDFGHMLEADLKRMFFEMYDIEITKALLPREEVIL